MINLEQLTEKDIGRFVEYHSYPDNIETGRIKSWNKKWIFVVYNCGGDWIRYRDYTAAATNPKDLQFMEREP
jgi:hypothetical protein